MKTNFNELKNAKTFHELFGALDISLFTSSALVISLGLVITPFIALFTGYDSYMYTYLLLLGYLGCVLTLFSFIKSRLAFKLSNKKYFTENIIPIFLFIMLLWAIPSTILASDFDTAFYGSSYRQDGLLMAFTYCGYFGCGYIAAKGNKLHYIFNLFSIIAVILAIFMIIDSPFLNMHFRTTHTNSVFFNRNHTGYYFCIATILNSVEILRLNLKTKKDTFLLIIRLIVFGICFYGNILTNSTGSFLGIVFGGCCLIFATTLFNKQILKQSLFIFGAIIIVTIISVFTAQNPLLYALQVFIDLGFILKDPLSEDALHAGSARWEFWLGALQFVKEKPLFGYGPDCLDNEYARIGLPGAGRPHCEPLQFAAELGVPASIAYLISIITFTVTFFKKKVSNPLVIGLVCTVGAYFCSSLFGLTFFYTAPFFYMIYGMATGTLKNS